MRSMRLQAADALIVQQLVLPSLMYLNHSFPILDTWLWDFEAPISLRYFLLNLLLFHLGANFRLEPERISMSVILGYATGLGIACLSRAFLGFGLRWLLSFCALVAGYTDAAILQDVSVRNGSRSARAGRCLLVLTLKVAVILTVFTQGCKFSVCGVWWMFMYHTLLTLGLSHLARAHFPTIFLRYTTEPPRLDVEFRYHYWMFRPIEGRQQDHGPLVRGQWLFNASLLEVLVAGLWSMFDGDDDGTRSLRQSAPLIFAAMLRVEQP